jgi:hypothetical protein
VQDQARRLTLAVIFAVQIAGIVYARFAPTRYLSWAPYDQISFYQIDVTLHGRGLTPVEVAARYRMPASGRENRSIHHVLNTVAQYEATYGRGDGADVVVRFRVNGGQEQVWSPPR